MVKDIDFKMQPTAIRLTIQF